MKIIGIGSLLLLGLLQGSDSFSPLHPQVRRSVQLFSTVEDAPSDIEEATLEEAKSKLVDVAKKLHTEHGALLVAKGPKSELKEAVEALETLGSSLSLEESKATLLGDWTLLVSTATNRDGVDTSRLESLPANFLDPIKKIRASILDTIDKYIVIQQKVKSTEDNGVIDRIDHTLELEPPAQLRDVLDNLPEQLMDVNINPLSVSKSKVVLIHKASVEDEMPLKTKIALQSIVLNVAGTSQVLEPDGKDIAGINIPSLGDFMNTADFETTYMDQDIRISRGKLGFVDQLRVFVRTEPPTTKVDIAQEVSEEDEIVDIESDVEAPSDVEDDDDDDDVAP